MIRALNESVMTNIDAPETVIVKETRVSCDGASSVGGGTLGHPKVFIQIGEEGFADCPYCDRRFILASSSEAVGQQEISR